MALESITLLSNNSFKFVDQETKDKGLLGLPWKPADQKSGRKTKITSSTHPSSYGFPLSFYLGSHICLKKLFYNYFSVLPACHTFFPVPMFLLPLPMFYLKVNLCPFMMTVEGSFTLGSLVLICSEFFGSWESITPL